MDPQPKIASYISQNLSLTNAYLWAHYIIASRYMSSAIFDSGKNLKMEMEITFIFQSKFPYLIDITFNDITIMDRLSICMDGNCSLVAITIENRIRFVVFVKTHYDCKKLLEPEVLCALSSALDLICERKRSKDITYKHIPQITQAFHHSQEHVIMLSARRIVHFVSFACAPCCLMK